MEKASCDCLSTLASMNRCTACRRKPPFSAPAAFLPRRCRWLTMNSKKLDSVSKLIWEGGKRLAGACEAACWERKEVEGDRL